MVLDLSGSQRTCSEPAGGFHRLRFGSGAATTQKISARLQTETGAAVRSPTGTQKLGSRLGTDFWGRHGFDGNGCGQEACRGSHTLNRVQNNTVANTELAYAA